MQLVLLKQIRRGEEHLALAIEPFLERVQARNFKPWLARHRVDVGNRREKQLFLRCDGEHVRGPQRALGNQRRFQQVRNLRFRQTAHERCHAFAIVVAP